MDRTERGQATVEWSALLLLVVLLVAGFGYGVTRAASWRYGGDLLHSLVCAIGGDCAGEPDALARAYGKETAELVRKYSPNVAYERSSAELPIDFRRCRRLECSNGPDRVAEISRSSAGLPVTAFTRVVDRRPAGGPLYIQYWFYYPESFTGGIGRLLGPFAHDWPGYHPDDWEGVQVMLPVNGRVLARATAHGGYSSGWAQWTGWYRVLGGSHAGQLGVGRGDERTTASSRLELVPLERLRGLGALRFAVTPPWLKTVYSDPESASS
jgi:hypothetical protein